MVRPSSSESESRYITSIDKGLKNLIVTLGEKGALWLRGDETTRVEAPVVDAVDTTGAGDAFIGCFAHGYAQNGDVENAMALAVKYASHSVTGKGTQTSYASGEAFAALL